jgi:hypothetical protein
MVAKPLAEQGADNSTSHAPAALDAAIEIVDSHFRRSNRLDHLYVPSSLSRAHRTQLMPVHQGAEIVQLVLDHDKLQSPDIIS